MLFASASLEAFFSSCVASRSLKACCSSFTAATLFCACSSHGSVAAACAASSASILNFSLRAIIAAPKAIAAAVIPSITGLVAARLALSLLMDSSSRFIFPVAARAATFVRLSSPLNAASFIAATDDVVPRSPMLRADACTAAPTVETCAAIFAAAIAPPMLRIPAFTSSVWSATSAIKLMTFGRVFATPSAIEAIQSEATVDSFSKLSESSPPEMLCESVPISSVTLCTASRIGVWNFS